MPNRPAPYQVRAARLDQRDAAVRAALQHLGDRPYTAACELERRLRDLHARGGWNAMQPDDAKSMPALLNEIMRENNGRVLQWRQIRNIAIGTRTPEISAINSSGFSVENRVI